MCGVHVWRRFSKKFLSDCCMWQTLSSGESGEAAYALSDNAGVPS